VGNIPEYVAPELTLGERATEASDMFSFGLVMYDLFFAFKEAPGGPSLTRPTFLETMKNEGKIEIPSKGKDPHLVKLLTSLLNPAPAQRLSAHDALDHKYFTQGLDKSTEESLLNLNAWRNDQYKKEKQAEIQLLNERHAFFQRTNMLISLRNKLLVSLNAHRLTQLTQQLEWSRAPEELKKYEELRKERLSLERKQHRVAEKMTNLEDEKQKWRQRFYQSINKQRQVKLNWQNIISTETQAIARSPPDWTSSSLSKFTLYRVNVTDQLKEHLAPLLNGLPIVSIERIEQTQLWQKYVQTRESLSKFGTRKPVPVSTDILWMHSNLHISNYVNEVMLWHPVTEERSVESIINQGFAIRVSDLRGTLGSGVYFWESVEPILVDATGGSQEECLAYVILSRVCLGTPHFTTKPLYGISAPPLSMEESKGKKNKKDKEKDKEKPAEKDEEKEKEVSEKREIVVDSVVGRFKPFKQFVVYDKAQAYPQFVVTIKVSGKSVSVPIASATEDMDENEHDDAGESSRRNDQED